MNEYQPYPGVSAQDFAEDFLTRSPITLQSFCKNERIDPRDLPRLVREVLTEWELTEPRHTDRRDAVTHLINHLRIKNSNEKRNNAPSGSVSSGRSQRRNPTALDLAREILGDASSGTH